jgi:hypothetical protein
MNWPGVLKTRAVPIRILKLVTLSVPGILASRDLLVAPLVTLPRDSDFKCAIVKPYRAQPIISGRGWMPSVIGNVVDTGTDSRYCIHVIKD